MGTPISEPPTLPGTSESSLKKQLRGLGYAFDVASDGLDTPSRSMFGIQTFSSPCGGQSTRDRLGRRPLPGPSRPFGRLHPASFRHTTALSSAPVAEPDSQSKTHATEPKSASQPTKITRRSPTPNLRVQRWVENADSGHPSSVTEHDTPAVPLGNDLVRPNLDRPQSCDPVAGSGQRRSGRPTYKNLRHARGGLPPVASELEELSAWGEPLGPDHEYRSEQR
jgi:hypothetical protein